MSPRGESATPVATVIAADRASPHHPTGYSLDPDSADWASLLAPVLGSLPVGVGMITRPGELIAVSPTLAQLLGYPEASLRHRSVESLTHAADREGWRRTLARVWSGEGTTVRAEQRLLHKRGHAIWVELILRCQGEPWTSSYAVLHAQDISARKRAVEMSEFLADAARVLSESMDVDELLDIIPRLAVPRMGDWCMIDLASAHGQSLRSFAIAARDAAHEATLRAFRAGHAWDLQTNADVLSRVLRTGSSRLFRFLQGDHLEQVIDCPEARDALKAVEPTSLLFVPLAARSRVLGVLTLGTSQSDRELTDVDRETAEEFAASAALALDNAGLYLDARRAQHARDDLLAFIAHDLRQPLNVAARAAHELHTSDSDAERENAAESLVESTTTAAALIDDLLDVSRIEAGRLHVAPEAVDTFTALREAFEAHREVAHLHGLLLNLDVTPVSYVHADAARVRQALSHLLDNAVQHTPPGGSITISARDDGDDVAFSISDTGRGIAPEELPYIFNRAWEGARHGCGSAGLGMALVKGIVDAHGGRVSVESDPGFGTTVTFTLPAWRRGSALSPAPTQPARCTSRGVEPARVLIVDHRANARSTIRETLSSRTNIDVVGEAITGTEALERMALLRPNVVLVDLHLPGLDAIDTVRAIAGLEDAPRVIVLVGAEEDAAVSEAFAAGARGFLRHSASRDELVGAVRAVARGELLVDAGLGDGAAELDGPSVVHGPLPSAELMAQLSPRERDVLMLAAQGFTAWQSGERLNLSPKTVETYRSRAMRKLGIDSRSELVSFALHAGLFSA